MVLNLKQLELLNDSYDMYTINGQFISYFKYFVYMMVTRIILIVFQNIRLNCNPKS